MRESGESNRRVSRSQPHTVLNYSYDAENEKYFRPTPRLLSVMESSPADYVCNISQRERFSGFILPPVGSMLSFVVLFPVLCRIDPIIQRLVTVLAIVSAALVNRTLLFVSILVMSTSLASSSTPPSSSSSSFSSSPVSFLPSAVEGLNC